MKYYRTILIGMLLSVLFVLSVPSVFADSSLVIADGHVVGQCMGWPKPHVELRWSDRQPLGALLPNMNAVLRTVDDGSPAWFFGGAYPGATGMRIDGSVAAAFGSGGFPNANFGVYDLRDNVVSAGRMYAYSVKYRPETASTNTYVVTVNAANCGGSSELPVATLEAVRQVGSASITTSAGLADEAPPSGPLTLSPSSQTVPPAVTAFVSATGGDGNYGWEVPDGKVLGSGSTVGVVFANDSLQAVTRTVTVHSGGQSTSVNVRVEGIRTFTDDIELTGPGDRYVLINEDAPITSDPNVTLRLSHGLPPGNDAAVTFRIANTLVGVSLAPLRAYTGQIAWNLCQDLPVCEEGPLTAYVIYRDSQGTEFPMVMDNILYQKGLADEPVMLINGGTLTTLDRNVTLTLKHGFPPDVRDDEVTMRIANTATDVTTAPVLFYVSSVVGWDVCSGSTICANGVKTIYVRYCARGVCQPVVQDDIVYGALVCVPRPVCEDPLSACANPAEEPEGGWCPVPTPTPSPLSGVLIDDGASVTLDRLVKLTFRTPFNGTLGEYVRIINANDLSQRDRDIIIQRGGGIAGQTNSRQAQDVTRLPPETEAPELESGTVTNFTPSLNGWDLCQNMRTCGYGTYRVYVQYYGIAMGVGTGGGLLGLNDQVSEIYYDTIVYTSPTPTPSVSEAPSPTVTPSGGPTIISIFGPVGQIIAGAAGVINSISVISAIAVAASALAALIPLLSSGLGAFIYQWFMGVLGLLPGRKKTWGTVYDANTKRPIPFAKVQLLDRNRRVLETHIADKDGRYGFLTTPESLMAQNLQISILPSHEGYSFPSHTPASIDTFIYNNLYYGRVIEVNDKTLINFDIPMDPLVASRAPLFLKSPSIAAGAAVAAVADAGFWLGLIMVPLNFALSPSPFTFGVLCLFLGTASLRLFGISEHPYGAVMDATTGRPMSFALITLNDMTGKRVGFAVSDERGRYFLVVEKGTYEMTVFTPAMIVPSRRSVQTVTAKKGWITREIKV